MISMMTIKKKGQHTEIRDLKKKSQNTEKRETLGRGYEMNERGLYVIG